MSQILNSFKWWQPLKKILYCKVTGNRVPLRAEIHVTKLCNLRCIHCYYDFESMDNVKDPGTSEMIELIDELYANGTRWVRFLGGEPLLRSDIGELISYATGKGMICDLNTNGYLVKKRIKELKKLSSLCLSIDGDEESNDLVRGKGSYQKIIEALDACLENDILVRLHGVITQYTLNSLDHLVNLARDYGVTFNVSEAARPDMSDINLTLNEEERINFYKKFIAYKKKGWPILNSYPAMEYVLNWPFGERRVVYEDDLKERKVPFVRCQQTLKSFLIDTDGCVYSCTGRWKMGINCFEHGFKKAWEYIGEHTSCVTCMHLGYIELSMLLNLDSRIILNAFRKMYMD